MKKISGRIIKGIGGFYYVRPTGSLALLETKARGKFRHQKITPMVGDYVDVAVDGKETAIDTIKTRKNAFVRPPVANVDVAIIVFAAANPDPNLFLLNKLLITAEYREVEPIICITKTDLVSTEAVAEIAAVFKDTPYAIVPVSNVETGSLKALTDLLSGKTAFLAGPSGVGKSTLANRLCAASEMETGGLSEKLGRGKHTTRHVELLNMDCGGYLLDTPGFSSLDIDEEMTAEDLKFYFPEFAQGACKFMNCTHRSEPKCAVKAQVEEGTINPLRYEHYLELYDFLGKKESWR